MKNEVLAFAIGFAASYVLFVTRLGMFKNKLRLYETYVQRRLDETIHSLQTGLISH